VNVIEEPLTLTEPFGALAVVKLQVWVSEPLDPTTVTDHPLHTGQGFTVTPGAYHRLRIDPDPAVPTVTLCLFERVDPDAPDAVVLTNRPAPVVADRDMSVQVSTDAEK